MLKTATTNDSITISTDIPYPTTEEWTTDEGWKDWVKIVCYTTMGDASYVDRLVMMIIDHELSPAGAASKLSDDYNRALLSFMDGAREYLRENGLLRADSKAPLDGDQLNFERGGSHGSDFHGSLRLTSEGEDEPLHIGIVYEWDVAFPAEPVQALEQLSNRLNMTDQYRQYQPFGRTERNTRLGAVYRSAECPRFVLAHGKVRGAEADQQSRTTSR